MKDIEMVDCNCAYCISLFSCQCYKDLGQRIRAQQMCDAASGMSIVTKEVFPYL